MAGNARHSELKNCFQMTTNPNANQQSIHFITVFIHSFRTIWDGFKAQRWCNQIKEIQSSSEGSILVSVIWWSLSILSLPLGYLHELFKVWFACLSTFRGQLKSLDCWQIRNEFDSDVQRRLKYTERWAVVWLITNIVLLFQGSSFWYLIPLLRLFDFLYIEWCRFVRNSRVLFHARWVVLLVIHYLEIVVIFASLYLFLQASHANAVFFVNTDWVKLDTFQVLHFSVMNAVTIGSSVTPVLDKSIPYLSSPAFWSWFEFVFVLFITVVEIPRLLNTNTERNPQPKSDEQRK